jgi:4-amino-4-deoxy-L-arabinose transferase-like glycosyltransferase
MKLNKLFTRHKTVVLIVLFFVALAVRVYRIDSKNVWMDESYQARLADTNPYNFDLAARASKNCQPPLDYFIQSILIKNFGCSEIGIRLHAAILGTFTVIFFFLLLVRIRIKGPAIFLGTLVFVFHPLLIHYSQEGRPISTAVFFSVLYLFFLVELFQTTSSDRPLIQTFAVLTLIQIGFFLSVGFQPVIFLLVSSICLIPYLAVKEKRLRVLIVYLSSMLAFLISFPIIHMTIRSGVGYQFIKQDSFLDMIKPVLQNISNITLDSVLHFYHVILEDYVFFFIVVIIIGIIGFILSSLYRNFHFAAGFRTRLHLGANENLHKRTAQHRGSARRAVSSKKRDYMFVVSYFTMFFLIYPWVYAIVFTALIPRKLLPRYYLTFAPVCFILMITAIYFIIDMLIKPVSFPKWLSYIIVILLVPLFIYSFVLNVTAVSKFYHMKKTEWKKMYDIFRYDSEPGDIAYMLNLVNIDRYSPDFRAKNIYYPVIQMRPVILKHARNIPNDLRNREVWQQKKNIYIATRYGSGKIKKSFFTGVENIDVFLFKGITLIRIKKSSSRPKDDLISLLRALKANLPGHESNYLLYEIIIRIDLYSGNIGKARKNIEILEVMDKRKKLNKLIRGFREQLKKLEKNSLISSNTTRP